MTQYVDVYPRQGTTYPDAAGDPIGTAGATVPMSKYIRDALTDGDLLTQDPLGVYQPDGPRTVIPVTVESYGIDPYTYGARPANTAAQNGVAFRAMRDYMIATDPLGSWIITFGTPGLYRYSFNKWLCGILDYIVDLGGSTLEYSIPTGYAETADTNTMFVWPDPWFAFDDGNNWYTTNYGYHNGYRIATQAASEQTVTLLTPAHAAYLAEGDPVLIAGWDPSWVAYPPPFEAFEYNTIVSVVGSVVTLREKTRNRYSQDWPDHANPEAGAARIYLLRNRARDPAMAVFDWADMPRRGEFRNGTLQGTHPTTGNTFYLAGYESCRVSNLRINAIQWFLNSEQVTASDITWFGDQVAGSTGITTMDIDKCMSSLRFERCKMHWVSGATSVRTLSMRDCVVEAGITTQAKRQIFENVVVGQKSTVTAPIVTQYKSTFRNVQAACNLTSGGGWLEPFDWTGSTFTIATINGSDNSLVTFVEQPHPDIPRLKPGDRLMKTDAAYHGVVVDAVAPRTFRVKWSSAPTVAHVFYLIDDYVFDVDEASGNTAGWIGCIPRARGGSVTLRSPALELYSVNVFYLPTKITSVVVDVTKAGAVHGFFMIRGTGGTPNLVRIATDSTGTRTCTSAGVTGITGNDYKPFGDPTGWLAASAWTNLAAYAPRVRIDYSAGGSRPQDWPEFTVTINCEELKF